MLEGDAVTPVNTLQAGPLPAACAAIQAKVEEKELEIKALQDDLRAEPTRKYQSVGAIGNLRSKQYELRRELARCIRDNATLAPVQSTVAQGIMASSASPGIFMAEKLGDGEWYVDGGIRALNPVEAALHLGADHMFILSAPAADLERASSFDGKGILDIGLRAGAQIAINQIGRSETQPIFGFGRKMVTVIQPTIEIHDPMTIDPGLIRINASSGFMRAADVMAGAAMDSQRSRDVDELIMLRARQWQQECLLMGKGIPGVRPAGDYAPDPAMYGQVMETAGRVRSKVQQRRQAGYPLPSDAERWGLTWEAHPWSSDTVAPLVAVSPQADELVVMGMAIENQLGEARGRVMTARWSPATGWQAWEPVHFGWGERNSTVTAAVFNGEVHAFYVNGDRWVMRSIRNTQGTWGMWWPVGNSNAPNLQSSPGAPVHAAVVTNTQTAQLAARGLRQPARPRVDREVGRRDLAGARGDEPGDDATRGTRDPGAPARRPPSCLHGRYLQSRAVQRVDGQHGVAGLETDRSIDGRLPARIAGAGSIAAGRSDRPLLGGRAWPHDERRVPSPGGVVGDRKRPGRPDAARRVRHGCLSIAGSPGHLHRGNGRHAVPGGVESGRGMDGLDGDEPGQHGGGRHLARQPGLRQHRRLLRQSARGDPRPSAHLEPRVRPGQWMDSALRAQRVHVGPGPRSGTPRNRLDEVFRLYGKSGA